MNLMSIFPLVSFLFISLILGSRVIYLLKQGIHINPKSVPKSGYRSLLYPVFTLIFLVWFSELIRPALQLPELILPRWFVYDIFHSDWLKIMGIIIIVGAMILWTVTLFHFKSSLRFGLDSQQPGDLIKEGVFSRSRNPFFLSIDLYFTGLAFLQSSIFFIAMALLTAITIHLYILKEEIFLQHQYGEPYLTYKQHVRRYF